MSDEKVMFEVGEVVELKSGGPPMTVRNVWPEDVREAAGAMMATVAWFDRVGNLHSESLPFWLIVGSDRVDSCGMGDRWPYNGGK